MHADGKSTLASVSKWNSGKVNWHQFPLILRPDFIENIDKCRDQRVTNKLMILSQGMANRLHQIIYLSYEFLVVNVKAVCPIPQNKVDSQAECRNVESSGNLHRLTQRINLRRTEGDGTFRLQVDQLSPS